MTIKIKTTNSAFEGGNESYEIARILRVLADKIEGGRMPKKLMDINGNNVGSVVYK